MTGLFATLAIHLIVAISTGQTHDWAKKVCYFVVESLEGWEGVGTRTLGADEVPPPKTPYSNRL